MSFLEGRSSGRNPSIMVVDDAPEFHLVLTPLLQAEGYDIVSAYSGESAVELAKESRPDIVLLDIVLPGIDGVETCRQLREFNDGYILMLTSLDSESDKVVGFEAGADDYVTKPFSNAELLARMKALLQRSPLR